MRGFLLLVDDTLQRPPWLTQFRVLLRQSLLLERADSARLVAVVLFALVVLLLCLFTLGEIEGGWALLVAQIFVTVFLALQLMFLRTFEQERGGGAFDLLRTYPLHGSAWFVAKAVAGFAFGCIVLVPTVGVALLFSPTQVPLAVLPAACGISMAVVLGLAALGVLLSVMVLNARGRESLFPILFFPLATPLLLGGAQAALCLLNPEGGPLLWRWLGVVLSFDVIYLTLGVLFFDELL